MGDFSDFLRGQIVGARLAGASGTKMATLLGVSKAAVSKLWWRAQIMGGIVVKNQN